MFNSFFHIAAFLLFTAGSSKSCSDVSDMQHEVVNVTTLNILPNDKINDAVAIENVIKKAAVGTTLFFPAGTYLIDAPIYIERDSLHLQGEANTIFLFTNTNDFYAMHNRRVGMINIVANNISIEHITFDQNFRGTGKKDGDRASIASVLIGWQRNGKTKMVNGINISDNAFNDYYGDAVSASYGGANNVIISKNTFTSAYITGNWSVAGAAGEQAISIASGKNIQITDNKIMGALDDAIAVHRNASDVVISNNDITTTGGRIYIGGVTNCEVKNNSIRYIQDGANAIYLTFEEMGNIMERNINRNVLVENNKVYINKGVKVTAAIRLNGAGFNISIRNNFLQSEETRPIGIQVNEQVYQKNKQVILGDSLFITNNTINNFSTGIRLQTKNKISDAQVARVVSNATSGNVFNDNGFSFENRKIRIEITGNTFEKVQKNYVATYGDVPAVSKRSIKQFDKNDTD